MHRHRLIKIEILADSFDFKIVFKKENALQYVCLLDEARTKDPVPRPFLIDGSLTLVKIGNANQLPPGVAAWSPDVLFALAGGYLLLRMRS